MLFYISERSLEEAVERYNAAPGNKKFEDIQFVQVQDNGVTNVAVILIYTTTESAVVPQETKRKPGLGPFIGQPPKSDDA